MKDNGFNPHSQGREEKAPARRIGDKIFRIIGSLIKREVGVTSATETSRPTDEARADQLSTDRILRGMLADRGSQGAECWQSASKKASMLGQRAI